MLVDEYDAFQNNYLEPSGKEDPRPFGEIQQSDELLKSFWATMKSLSADGSMRRVFMTDISPLS